MTASNTAKQTHSSEGLLAAAGAEIKAGAAVFMGPLIAAGRVVITSIAVQKNWHPVIPAQRVRGVKQSGTSFVREAPALHTLFEKRRELRGLLEKARHADQIENLLEHILQIDEAIKRGVEKSESPQASASPVASDFAHREVE